LRANGVYEIVRAAHEAESVDKISECIERLVQLIKGEEPPIEQAMGEEEEYDAVPEGEIDYSKMFDVNPMLRALPEKKEEEEEEEGPVIEALGADSDEEIVEV